MKTALFAQYRLVPDNRGVIFPFTKGSEVDAMTEEGQSGGSEASLRIANEFVEFANNMLNTETHPAVIASGFRHAAANFTAFAHAQGTDDLLPIEGIVEEFVRLLESYDAHHRTKEPPMTSLERLVEQVKNE